MGDLADAKVLVTGATGFIGAHLVERLTKERAEVYVLIRREGRLGNLVRIVDYPDRRLNLRVGELLKYQSLQSVMKEVRPDKVFHLGGFVELDRSYRNSIKALNVNAKGTINLLQALGETSIDSFVYTGTCEVYGPVRGLFEEAHPVNPLSPYSISKFAGEQFCRMYQNLKGIPIVLLRLSYVYGPGQNERRLIPSVILACLKRKEIRVSSGMQRRDFNYVTDIVDALIKASSSKEAIGHVINIGNPKNHSVRDVVECIVEKMGRPSSIVYGAQPDRPLEAMDWRCDNRKARKLLGWRPRVELDEGLARTINYYLGKE